MSGVARIGGSNSKIAGGKALVGGSVCNLAGGKAMVGGSISTISLNQGVPISLLYDPSLRFTITYNGVTYAENLGDYTSLGVRKNLYAKPGEIVTVNMPTEMAVYVNLEVQTRELPQGGVTVLWSSFPITVGEWEYLSIEPYSQDGSYTDVGIFYK